MGKWQFDSKAKRSLRCATRYIKIKNQTFHYTRCITPKRVTSWRGSIFASLRPGNTASFEETSQRWRAVGNTESDLTGPRFEPRNSRSRNERGTVWPTGRLTWYVKMQLQLQLFYTFYFNLTPLLIIAWYQKKQTGSGTLFTKRNLFVFLPKVNSFY